MPLCLILTVRWQCLGHVLDSRSEELHEYTEKAGIQKTSENHQKTKGIPDTLYLILIQV